MNILSVLTKNHITKALEFENSNNLRLNSIRVLVENYCKQKLNTINQLVEPFSIKPLLCKNFYLNTALSLHQIIFIEQEKELLKGSPESALDYTAFSNNLKKEIEMNFLFSWFIPTPPVKEDREDAQIIQLKPQATPSLHAEGLDNLDYGLSQLTLDFSNDEIQATLPKPDSNNDVIVKSIKRVFLEVTEQNEQHIGKCESTEIRNKVSRGEDLNKLSNTSSDETENKDLSNNTLEKKELTSNLKEDSPSTIDDLTHNQVHNNLKESNEPAITPRDVVTSKTKKEKQKPNRITIDYIAECIANRKVTTLNHFRKLIKGHWKIKLLRNDNELAEITKNAKGGKIDNPVQDMELLKKGLEDFLFKL
ncbi:hypothetical protein C1N61_26350 (plasmid) [Priestia aryabhattai]